MRERGRACIGYADLLVTDVALPDGRPSRCPGTQARRLPAYRNDGGISRGGSGQVVPGAFIATALVKHAFRAAGLRTQIGRAHV